MSTQGRPDLTVVIPTRDRRAGISLAANARSRLPPPVAVVSGIETVIGDRVVDRRLPPSHPRGEYFSLTPPPAGRSHMTKNTLVVDRDLLRELGGFDEQGLLRLAAKHRKLLAAHPAGHADMLLGHVRMSVVSGPRRAIVPALTRAFGASPRHTASVLLDPRRMARAFVTRRSSG